MGYSGYFATQQPVALLALAASAPRPCHCRRTREPRSCVKQPSTPAHAPRPAGPENRLWLAEHHRQNRLPPACHGFVKNLFFYLFFHRRCMAPDRRQLAGDPGANPAIAEHRPAVRNRPSKPCVFRGIPTKGAWHVVGSRSCHLCCNCRWSLFARDAVKACVFPCILTKGVWHPIWPEAFRKYEPEASVRHYLQRSASPHRVSSLALRVGICGGNFSMRTASANMYEYVHCPANFRSYTPNSGGHIRRSGQMSRTGSLPFLNTVRHLPQGPDARLAAFSFAWTVPRRRI